MIDKKIIGNTQIFKEFSLEDSLYWFDFKREKFLHNIDTFYFSVKFQNDFRFDSDDDSVLKFRKFFEQKVSKLNKYDSFNGALDVFFEGFVNTLFFRPFSYGGYYKYCLECPEYFDFFFAPSVPCASDGGESVTPECIVQIRSYPLWLFGVVKCFEMALNYVEIIASEFGLSIDKVEENRTDFCWHSNYLRNPEKFFTPEKFYKMRVDRFNSASYHTAKVGRNDFEIDYVSMGKRSEKLFIRIYLKSKEVVEKGYKDWFFKIWLFNNLINRYDFFVYEYAFKKHSWSSMDLGRLQFYYDYGSDASYRLECSDILEGRKTVNTQELKNLADKLTPKVNLIMNVEYQVMRKHSKSYVLLPRFDNTSKGYSKRVYDFFDNRALITDYLTSKCFRLVDIDSVSDSNKSRAPDCKFWERLRHTKLVDSPTLPDNIKLVREYHRKMSAEFVKESALKSIVTLGLYERGFNSDSAIVDCFDFINMLNDNDIYNLSRFKQKKIKQLNEDELLDVHKISKNSSYSIVINESGEVIS